MSLVAEDLAKAEHAEQALEVLGGKFLAARGRDRSWLLRRWPAVHVMSTVSIATHHYSHGTFWPKLTGMLGIRGDQSFQQEWGTAFLENLRALGLPDFGEIEDSGARFVGPILMHSGIPTHCLADYFKLVGERRSRDEGITPDEFVAWAASKAAEGKLFNIDKPVERFLRYGGDFAIDVSDRVFELLDVVAAGGTGEEVPLPDRFRVAAVALRQAGGISERRPRGHSDGHEAERPGLVLDPYGRGPLLRLPPVDEVGQATWTVTVGTQSEHVHSEAAWPGEPAPPTDVPVIGPVRAVTAALQRRPDLTMTVPVVDDKDPLLAFSEEGRQLLPGLPLPGFPVWLLFPGGPDDLVVVGEAVVLAEGALPPGWSGWTLRLLDLRGASMVRSSRCERPRSVRRVSSVRIAAGEPIQGLLHRGGPVFGQVPQIELPSAASTDSSWSLTITDAGGRVLVDNRMLHAGDDLREGLWSGVPRPLLGTYRIRVRGPWGRGISRDLVLAEGVRMASQPPWRRIAPDGLVPATIRLSLPPGVEAEQSSFELAGHETEQQVTLTAHHTVLRAVVRPPHMSMSYQSSERSTTAGVRPVPLYAEDLRELGGTLTIDLDAVGDPTLHVLVGDRCVQELVTFGRSRDGVYRFNLAQVGDTLAAHPRARLSLDEAGLLVVSQVSPRRLYSEVKLTGDILELVDSVDVEGLVALVYPVVAPWRGGTRLEVRHGQVELPEELRDAGPVVVTVRVDDPWAPASVPAWPAPQKAWLLSAPGWLSSEDAEETSLSRWLAGAGPLPADIADLSRVWAVTGRLPWLGLMGERLAEVGKACRNVLTQDPVSSLLALDSSGIEADRVPEAIIRSGLAWTPTALPSRGSVAWTRAGALPAALLTAPGLVDDVRRGLDTAANARVVCGDGVDSLLRGNDPWPGLGRFDTAADRYLALGSTAQLDFRNQLRLVPQGLVDGDTRVQASLNLLDRRRDASAGLQENGPRCLQLLRAYLKSVGDLAGVDAVAARCHPTRSDGWRCYPALSLSLAWMARRVARGDAQARQLVAQQGRLWADLARIAPDLVTIDLIVAELLQAAEQSSASQEDK
ncbi:hypothetical protein ACSDQ9_01780 [Aestuariimicrobium soli]|uniref:hypothetical protein n=1 Tax=Aestuariimicrobium soli TaxID=2035834 RepID=UPI003EBA73A0